MDSFASAEEASAYADAYARTVSKRTKSKQKEFFGDEKFYNKDQKEWEEIVRTNSDPLTTPGKNSPSHNWWG